MWSCCCWRENVWEGCWLAVYMCCVMVGSASEDNAVLFWIDEEREDKAWFPE